MAKTADALLIGLKRRTVQPSAQPLLTNDDMLALADDVIMELMVPAIKAAREDYFVTTTEQDITANVATYDIPYRAIGRGLRYVNLRDTSSTRKLTKIALEDAILYPTGNTPIGFYFKGDKLVVVPSPAGSGLSLDIWWESPPGRLVELDQVGVVTSFTSTTVTVDTAPDTISTGTVIDFIQARSGNTTLAYDKTVTNVSSTIYTFNTDDIPSDIAIGDYVSVAGTSPVIQLPNEAYPLLETATAGRILKTIGDFEGAGALRDDENNELKRFREIIEPRVEGNPTKIINNRGLLRMRLNRYRRGIIY